MNTLIKFPIIGLDMTPYLTKSDITRPSSALAYQNKLIKTINGGSIPTTTSSLKENKTVNVSRTLPTKNVHFEDIKKTSQSHSSKKFIWKKNKKSKKSTDPQVEGKSPRDGDPKTSILANKNREDNLFDLYAVCNHHGDMNRGHYIAHCLNPINNTWYVYDDHHVLPVINKDQLATQNAYILFYVKRSSRNKWLKSITSKEVKPVESSSGHWIPSQLPHTHINIQALPGLDYHLFSPQRQGSVTSAHTMSTASGVSPDNVFFPSHMPQLSTETAATAFLTIPSTSYGRLNSASSSGPTSPQSTLLYPHSLPSPSIISTPSYFSQQYQPPPSHFTRRAGSFHSSSHYHANHPSSSSSESHSATRV